MRDSTTPLVSIEPGSTDRIAAYVNGLFAADLAELERHFPGVRIYGIDVLGTAPHIASIPDVETGDLSADRLADWIRDRLSFGPKDGHGDPTWLARPYSNISTWPSVRAAVRTLPAEYRRQARYWIANPTGERHIVPGSSATQYFWGNASNNIDISEVGGSWDQ
jgi:hypothetical protein